MKKLGFGFMRLPLLDKENQASFDVEQVNTMVDKYLEKGFTYFDTAYFYHDKQSESMLKKALVDRYPREKFILATKMPIAFLKCKEDVDRIFNEQLEKTGAGYFDYYLMHCLTTDLYKVATEFGAIEYALQKKKEGVIKRLGFSFHDKPEVLDKILCEHPEFEFVQLQINYLDWENPKVQSRACYEVARTHGKEIIVMEPVKGGALAKVPESAEKLFYNLNPDMSAASWAIRFAASLPGVFMVLSGMSNIEQINDNTSYMENFVPLTENEKKVCFKVADIIRASRTIPCTSCRYCVDGCPGNIAIPDYFEIYNRGVTSRPEVFSSIKTEYLELSEKCGKLQDCIECRKCEESCPQHINIVEKLKKVEKLFG